MVVALTELTMCGSISIVPVPFKHVGRGFPSKGMNSVPGTETEEYTTNRMSSGIGFMPCKFANKNILHYNLTCHLCLAVRFDKVLELW